MAGWCTELCNPARKAPGARLAAATAPLLLLAVTLGLGLGLGLAQLLARPSQPMALLFPAGLGPDGALRRFGPFTLALVAPSALVTPGQPGHPVPRAAWLVLAAPDLPPCLATPQPAT